MSPSKPNEHSNSGEREPSVQDQASARMHARLERIVLLAQAALLWERLWRALLPVFAVIGVFFCVSWAGLWLEIPHPLRLIGVLAFGLALVAALIPLARLSRPTRAESLARIDRASDVPHRPAEVLEDRLANATEDPGTRALWELHRRRAEMQIMRLRAGTPSPRLVDRDRWALRAGLAVALIACAFLAGPEKYARIAAAFAWRSGGTAGAGTRLDAWIDPPPYTGKAPVLLNLAAAEARKDKPQRIEAPIGSHVIIRSTGGTARVEMNGGLKDAAAEKSETSMAAPSAAPPPSPAPSAASSEPERRLVLRGDGRLTLAPPGGAASVFDLVAIPDKPPSIALNDVPRANARGTLTLAYRIGDDYGVTGADASFLDPTLDGKRVNGRSLVEPPKVGLGLPPGPGGLGDSETTADLSDHPWAGTRVTMILSARDEGGNEGQSAPVEITLPQKPFTKPIARALVEQRRHLVLAPDDRQHVLTALDALMLAPDVFDTSAAIYLGLTVASQRLKNARTDADLVEVADYLWDMALRIENGDVSDAERDLRAAESRLREALQRGASEDEIAKLTQELRAAMDKFLREFADRQMRGEDRQQDADREPDQRRTITPRELQSMLDRMQEMARSGDLADAQRMLEQLRNMLDNLQTARRRNVDPQAREMNRAMNELDRLTREQQDLRDQTYRQGRKRQSLDPHGQPQSGMQGRGRAPQDQDDEDSAENDDDGQDGAPKMGEQELRQRQEALRNRLEQLRKSLKQMGAGEQGLDDADGAMQDAENGLGQGGKPGRGKAVDAQGRALEALRRGAEQLAQQMQQQGEGDPSEDADEGGDDATQGAPRRSDRSGNADPLGRPMANDPANNPRSRYDPMGVPAAQRAQQVLEELRRRLSDPSRPQEETDYLERLLKRY